MREVSTMLFYCFQLQAYCLIECNPSPDRVTWGSGFIWVSFLACPRGTGSLPGFPILLLPTSSKTWLCQLPFSSLLFLLLLKSFPSAHKYTQVSPPLRKPGSERASCLGFCPATAFPLSGFLFFQPSLRLHHRVSTIPSCHMLGP